MADYEIGKMEQAARKRRERLLAMKKKMKKDANKEKKVIMKKPQVNFRSYQPENDTVKEKKRKGLKLLIQLNTFRFIYKRKRTFRG